MASVPPAAPVPSQAPAPAPAAASQSGTRVPPPSGPTDVALHPLAVASDAMAALVARIGLLAVGVNADGRADGASGTLWRPGVVVTVAHPLGRGRRPLRVTLADGRTVAAQLAGMDHATDLAVLQLAQGTPDATADAAIGSPAPGGDATPIQTGHFVAALGRSAGGDLAASAGIVHRTGPAWQTWTGGRIDRLVRLDGGLFAGLSGGPVFDARGHVIGIANGALVRGGAVVVPAATIDRVIDELLARGRVARPYLGIVAQPVRLPAGSAGPDAGPPGVGLLVTGLDDAGPAHGAGLMVGDIVRAVAGLPVADIAALRGALATQRSGTAVVVAVLRGGAPLDLSLVTGEAPAPRAASEGCCR